MCQAPHVLHRAANMHTWAKATRSSAFSWVLRTNNHATPLGDSVLVPSRRHGVGPEIGGHLQHVAWWRLCDTPHAGSPRTTHAQADSPFLCLSLACFFVMFFVTRASEAKEFRAKSTRMVDHSRMLVREKYMPRMQSALDKGGVTEDKAAKLLFSIAKQKADGNYYGTLERTSSRKLWTPYEQTLFKGIGINRVDDQPAKKADIIAKIKSNMRGTGQDPSGVIAMVLAAREANTD